VCARAKDKLHRKCTADGQQFGTISLRKTHLGVINITAVCKGTSRGNIQKDYA
jgi:hypothetical protein